MKTSLTALLTMLSVAAMAQDTTHRAKVTTYQPHSVIATLSVGIWDGYRYDYKVPSGFTKGTISGFAPVQAKVEYGLGKHISLGAVFYYDNFIYNNNQYYNGNNGPFPRYRANKTRIFGGGLVAYYHLQELLHSRRLDPFVGIGVSLNNIRYGAYPQGDSTVVKIDHSLTPYAKAGARYYVSDRFSLYFDAGYAKEAVVSLGFSCRFLHKKPI